MTATATPVDQHFSESSQEGGEPIVTVPVDMLRILISDARLRPERGSILDERAAALASGTVHTSGRTVPMVPWTILSLVAAAKHLGRASLDPHTDTGQLSTCSTMFHDLVERFLDDGGHSSDLVCILTFDMLLKQCTDRSGAAHSTYLYR